MVPKHYIMQMFSLSASCCFGCQLVQCWWRGEGDLAGNCSLAANTVFTITSSHLAVLLKLFVVHQPKERKSWIRFYTFGSELQTDRKKLAISKVAVYFLYRE